MLSSVGRRREHDARTARALLDAAEQIVQEGGIDALSVRTVAARVGTTTRAVYSLFGSKERLMAALGVRAFETLGTGVAALPTSADPAADLVAAGATVFRDFAVEHPALFRIAMQHAPAWAEVPDGVMGAATDALGILVSRMSRLQDAGCLGPHTLSSATLAFHALCEGLAAGELRGSTPADEGERFWRAALGALVAGFAHPAHWTDHRTEPVQARASTPADSAQGV
jgi:AcrR family transcriptional regulator